MAVLFAGGENESFQSWDASRLFVTTNAGDYYDANYSRGAMHIREISAVVDLGASYTDVWAQVRRRSGSGISSSDNSGGLIIMRAANGDILAAIRARSSSAGLGIAHRTSTTATAWTDVLPNFPSESSTARFWTFHFKKVASNQALMELFVDGELVSSATVTHTWFNGKDIKTVEFQGGNGSTYSEYFSEFVIADEDPRGWRIATLAPNADGSTVAWGGSYVDIDEIGEPDDNDYITSATAGQTELFGLSNLSAAGQNMAVKALVLTGRMRKGDTGPQNVQAVVRTGGVDYTGASVAALTGSFSVRRTVWAQNPNTSADWTVAQVQNLEAGFKSVA